MSLLSLDSGVYVGWYMGRLRGTRVRRCMSEKEVAPKAFRRDALGSQRSLVAVVRAKIDASKLMLKRSPCVSTVPWLMLNHQACIV